MNKTYNPEKERVPQLDLTIDCHLSERIENLRCVKNFDLCMDARLIMLTAIDHSSRLSTVVTLFIGVQCTTHAVYPPVDHNNDNNNEYSYLVF